MFFRRARSLLSLDFTAVLCVDNFFTAAQSVFEFGAALRLRTLEPHRPRPYRIPLSSGSLACVLVIPIGIATTMCYVTLTQSIESAATCSAGLAIGVGLGLSWLFTPEAQAHGADPLQSSSASGCAPLPCEAGGAACADQAGPGAAT